MKQMLYNNRFLLIIVLLIFVLYTLTINRTSVFEEQEYIEDTKECLDWSKPVDLSQHPCGEPDLEHRQSFSKYSKVTKRFLFVRNESVCSRAWSLQNFAKSILRKTMLSEGRVKNMKITQFVGLEVRGNTPET